VLEFCCQLTYGYVLMLILLHVSALIVCLCMSLYYVLHDLVGYRAFKDQFSLKSGQGQFFGILVVILKITAKLEIPEVP
jgi:hypothetical protein